MSLNDHLPIRIGVPECKLCALLERKDAALAELRAERVRQGYAPEKIELKHPMTDETRRIWETVQAAKREIARWPEWKRGDNSDELRLNALEARVEAIHQNLALTGGHTCRNQCDGCQRGNLADADSVHRWPENPWSLQACTANRYRRAR